MTEDDLEKFTHTLSGMLAYYRQPVSDFLLAVWWEGMQPYTLEQFKTAITRHAKNAEKGGWPPRVSDVIRELEGTRADRAVIAWGKALEAIGGVGQYTSVVFDDPAIHAAIADLGGWPKFCRGADATQLPFLQKRFCDAYRANEGRGTFPFPSILHGDRDPDDEYERRGMRPPAPVLIGDRKLALQVYETGSRQGRVEVTFGESLAALLPAPPRSRVS